MRDKMDCDTYVLLCRLLDTEITMEERMMIWKKDGLEIMTQARSNTLTNEVLLHYIYVPEILLSAQNSHCRPNR